MHCNQTHGLRHIIQHHCLVLTVPLVGPDHTIDVSVSPIHKILKNGNCMWMLQYLFGRDKMKILLTEADFTFYIEAN